MAPARPLKRQKTSPTDEPLPQLAPPSVDPLPSTPPPPTSESGSQQSPSQDLSSSSWYSRTWPRKAAPITQVARESISSAGSAAAEVASIVRDKVADKRGSTRSPSLAMTLGKGKANRSLPVDATTTKIHAIQDAKGSSRKTSIQTSNTDTSSGNDVTKTAGSPPVKNSTETAQGEATSEQTSTAMKPALQSAAEKGAQTNNSGWLSWLSRGVEAPHDAPHPVTEPSATVDANESSKTSDMPKAAPVPKTESTQADDPSATANNKRSWLQMWSSEAADRPSTAPNTDTTSAAKEAIPNKAASLNIPNPQTPLKPASPSQASSIETSPPPVLPGDSTKSSAWVFWSRDKKGNAVSSGAELPHIGEIAISDTPSQTRPKRASISVPEGNGRPDVKLKKPAESVPKAAAASKATVVSQPPVAKAGSVKKTETEQGLPSKGEKIMLSKPDPKTTKTESTSAAAVGREPVEAGTPRTASPAPSRKDGENLLLPAFSDTISLLESPSILQQLARLLYYSKESEFKHLSLVKDPPRMHNALAIGVHGYFPAPLIRTVLGQPTGTSIKFADMAAKSIKKWTRNRGYDCQVKTAALEGEGKIAERIELLWKLLLNWIDEIRRSDFVMIACHSQGVPVAIMLVAKLIQFGCVNAARVGICAMAGVNMGPFQDYKSRWISGSAGELFEFSNPDSKVSKDYLAAIEVALKFGVRLTFIGSIDDQLVSLESSIFSPITHPHIYRAVSVDARVHAPNFLSHLVGFALKLRNLGVQDHGLIRELSSPLAGSLYSGEGHSRLYENDDVYDLAVAFALETNALMDVPVMRTNATSTTGNPYILPFAMRGILEEEFVKTELQNEASELLKQFDEWKPTTKVLKDVKFRLEGIRSQL